MVLTAAPARPQTLEEFLAWEPLDGFKYEWNHGAVIQSAKMKKRHLYLIRRLNRLFLTTAAHAEGGELIPEQDVWLSETQMRRPDLAYFSAKQITESASSKVEPIPPFVIEVISPTDDAEQVESKVKEYFEAGVRVLWHLYFESQVIYVYTSRRAVTVCLETDVCSAAPVLPDFTIQVNELVALPVE
ncbi:MAG: Uma2 family endonuclease [Sphingobacteriaceae bacterium]|nr:Uma2 family endonuclease [Cytophagaceae bacterium]